jgi:DNA-binding response OmpR family regulator
MTVSRKLLIVDDDYDMAESIADLVEIRGYEADLASSGAEAIAKFQERDYDVAFMDVRMPGMNGVECLLEILKLKPDAKVVMMTAYSVEQLLNTALKNGAAGVLYKPFEMNEFLAQCDKRKGATA